MWGGAAEEAAEAAAEGGGRDEAALALADPRDWTQKGKMVFLSLYLTPLV